MSCLQTCLNFHFFQGYYICLGCANYIDWNFVSKLCPNVKITKIAKFRPQFILFFGDLEKCLTVFCYFPRLRGIGKLLYWIKREKRPSLKIERLFSLLSLRIQFFPVSDCQDQLAATRRLKAKEPDSSLMGSNREVYIKFCRKNSTFQGAVDVRYFHFSKNCIFA